MDRTTREGRELVFEVSGEGPAVAFIPDACVGPWSWAWVLSALGSGVRTVVYRPAVPTAQDGLGTLAADLEAVLGAASVQRVHLVGAGLGGLVALQYAHDHGRSRGLLMLGTGVHAVDPSVRDTLLDPDPLASLRPYLGDRLGDLDETTVHEWREREDPGVEGRRHQLELYAAEGPPRHEVTQPVWLRHGGADTVVPPSAGETLARALPAGTFQRVQEAPHLLPVATPTLVADELVGLLEHDEASS